MEVLVDLDLGLLCFFFFLIARGGFVDLGLGFWFSVVLVLDLVLFLDFFFLQNCGWR